MIKKYLDQLNLDSERLVYKNNPINCYLSDIHSSKLHKDIICISFNSLYPNLIIQLSDNGLIRSTGVDKIKWFLENKQELKRLSLTGSGSNEYTEWKKYVNSFFTRLSRKESVYLTYYLNLFYRDLLEKFNDDIIYIDTDTLFINNNKEIFKEIEKLDVGYVDNLVPYFWIENKKRLIYMLDDGEIESKGFKFESHKEKEKAIISIIITESRNDKLSQIGI